MEPLCAYVELHPALHGAAMTRHRPRPPLDAIDRLATAGLLLFVIVVVFNLLRACYGSV